MTDTEDKQRARRSLPVSLADDTLNRWLGIPEADPIELPDEPVVPRRERLPLLHMLGSHFIARSASPGASPEATWLESLFDLLAWVPLLYVIAITSYVIYRGLQVFGYL